jgi:hypothetical protein
MNPYMNLPPQNFWKATFSSPNLGEADFDFGRKFMFSATETFVAAGSCFAQHFVRELSARGGNVLIGEQRHPLISEDTQHGCGVYSARYGNIYTVRQLLELLQQALGVRNTIYEISRRSDNRWIDMLRPRAVPMGFSSEWHAMADRNYHLKVVANLVKSMDILVYTLGLTESWVNKKHDFCYPIVPGAISGDFSPADHEFKNFNTSETIHDLQRVFDLILSFNPRAKFLLTVSPIGLVATAEPRNVVVSTTVSKSILRAAVDEVIQTRPEVDYFPSFEIVTSPYSKSKYWANGMREVTRSGVEAVMDVFFHSRLPGLNQQTNRHADSKPEGNDEFEMEAEAAFAGECDEIFLDPEFKRLPKT